MEAMSDSISDNLAGQTEKLSLMKQKNTEVQGLLDRANSLVDSMWFKQKKNKLILSVVVALLVLFVMYHIF